MQDKSTYNLTGINVSSSYGAINWYSVAANSTKISFAYIRCTQGETTADSTFVNNVKNARNAGIKTGGYHDSTPSDTVDAITEATFFIQKLQLGFGTGQYGDINPVLVVQTPSPRTAAYTTQQLLDWIYSFKTFFESTTNRTLILYATPSFITDYENFLYPNGNKVLSMPLYIGYISTLPPANVGGWSKWLVWQYGTGTVSGITGTVSFSSGPTLMQDLQTLIIPTNYDNNLYVTDNNLKLQIVLSNNNNPMSSGACPYYNCVHTEQLNKMSTLTFDIPSDNESSYYVKSGNCVYYRDYDNINEIQLFEIIRVEENHNNVPIKNVYCELKVFELIDAWVDGYSVTGVSFETALTDTLGISRWKTGIVQVGGTKNVSLYRMNKMDRIYNLINIFGAGELKFRVQISQNNVINQFIDVLNPRGTYIGKRFEYTKDLKTIKRTIDSTGLVTLCYGYGSGDPPLTFSSVVWSTPTNPVNKPAGQIYVADPTALANYGRYDRSSPYANREGSYTNSEQTDAAQLLQETWNYIQQHNFPFATYEMDAADFEFLFGYSSEKVRLGDTVEVIDYDLAEDIAIKIRVVGINRCLSEPEKTSFVIGNIAPVLGGIKA